MLLAVMDETIREGHYAKKQLLNRLGLIRWSHQARFKKAIAMATGFKGQRILDFGCGDATFLALLADSPHPPSAAVGAEIKPEIVASNRQRFAKHPSLSFVLQPELESPAHLGKYDGLVCMEVFEHVEEQEPVLDLFVRLLKPGGRLLLSVPVETGPTVLVKTAARNLAGWMGVPSYPGNARYTWGELARSVVAGKTQHVPRRLYREPDNNFYCHKGFNWKVLRDKIARRFAITSISTSPLGWLPAGLNSQVWITAQKN